MPDHPGRRPENAIYRASPSFFISLPFSLLRIALRNLLANADRHAPEGESVRLEVTRQGEGLEIEVSNPSEPIAQADQDQLFERYYRGRNAQHRPGAGLGLYLVRRIAERLGGSVALLTAGGAQPVCLRLVLPVARA